jgi:choice-of-anchor C domain-containing protein
MRRYGRKHVVAVAFAGILITAGAAFAKTSTYPVARGNWERANVGASKSTLASGALFGRELKWHVGSGDIDVVGTYWDAALGRQSVDLNGDGPGSIYRDIHTKKGATYRFSIKLSGNPDCGPNVKRVEVFWDGASLGKKTFEIAGTSRTDMKWRNRNFKAVAQDSSTRLEFKSLTAGPCGPVLDNVQVWKVTS